MSSEHRVKAAFLLLFRISIGRRIKLPTFSVYANNDDAHSLYCCIELATPTLARLVWRCSRFEEISIRLTKGLLVDSFKKANVPSNMAAFKGVGSSKDQSPATIAVRGSSRSIYLCRYGVLLLAETQSKHWPNQACVAPTKSKPHQSPIELSFPNQSPAEQNRSQAQNPAKNGYREISFRDTKQVRILSAPIRVRN